MPKNIVDHDHRDGAPASAYSRIDRVRAGDGGHPKIRLLDRRRRKGPTGLSRVKQFLRIEREDRE